MSRVTIHVVLHKINAGCRHDLLLNGACQPAAFFSSKLSNIVFWRSEKGLERPVASIANRNVEVPTTSLIIKEQNVQNLGTGCWNYTRLYGFTSGTWQVNLH